MKRKAFNISQNKLLEYAKTVVGFLADDLDSFAAFDSDLGQSRRQQIEELVAWAYQEGGNTLQISYVSNAAEQLTHELERSKELLHQLRYWVTKSFHGQEAIQRQFGIGRFSQFAERKASTISFLSGLKETIATYRTGLEGAGTPQELLDLMVTHIAALDQADQVLESSKHQRKVATEERVSKLNALFSLLKGYQAAAPYVFPDSKEKRSRYQIPRNASKRKKIKENKGTWETRSL